MSKGIAIVAKGQFWETEVELQYMRTKKYEQGNIHIKGKELNLSKKMNALLGIEQKENSDDWKITPDVKLNYLRPIGENGSAGFLIGAKLGAFNFKYVSGGLLPTDKGNAFYVQLDIGQLLAAIPNFNSDWITGHIELGYASGTSFKMVQQNGELTFEPVQSGLQFSANLTIANTSFQFTPQKNEEEGNEEKTEGEKPDANALKEIEIDKSFGAIRLYGFSYQLKKQELLVLIKADLNLGPVSLSFLGLGASIDLAKLTSNPLDAIALKLYGLGLYMKLGSLEIAGLFVKTPNKKEYVGGVMIKTKAFAITGFGAYSDEGKYKSVFGFLALNANIGGSSSFFITGISICFGYNRRIIIPPINKIANFPLIRYALDTGSAPNFDSKKQGSKNPIVVFNENLGPYIPPKEGSFFLGIGVKFNTYKIMDTAAMLVIAAGDDLEFSLIGLTRISLPPNGTGTPLVFIEIALRASYSVNKGLLQVQGELTNRSYLFSQQVKLTGGFAFFAWFKDHETAKAGDFVISVGGYHPAFKVPKHYPAVPRLGLEWNMSFPGSGAKLSLSGKMYFALTPTAIMAGLSIHASWKDGSFYASFSFSADFLIQWKPFYYDARIAISFQVGFKISKWGMSKKFSIDIGADLHIWGPDFSGTAKLIAKVCGIGVSFSVKFGGADKNPKPLSWADFKSSFLPKNALGINNSNPTKIITAQVTEGLMYELGSGKEDEKIAVVNPKKMCLKLDSILPITSFKSVGKELKPLQSDISIPAMKKSGIKSTISIKLFRNGELIEKTDDYFIITPANKNLPRAMWNDRETVDQLSSDTTLDMTTGILIQSKDDIERGMSVTPLQKNFDFNQSKKAMEKNGTNSNSEIYSDFMILSDDYDMDEFTQIPAEEVQEYKDYYGDQTHKTNIDHSIKPKK